MQSTYLKVTTYHSLHSHHHLSMATATTPTTPIEQPHLLRLPREMRNEIYSQYLTVRDGYTYDFEAGKLRANG